MCFDKLKELVNSEQVKYKNIWNINEFYQPFNLRLTFLKDNNTLYRDYTTNPTLPGFDMVRLIQYKLFTD